MYTHICDTMDGIWVHYAKWNKLKTDTVYHLYVKYKRTELRNRMEGGEGGLKYVGQRVQNSSYKMNKFWRYNVQHSDNNNIVSHTLKLLTDSNKCSNHKKEMVIMLRDGDVS